MDLLSDTFLCHEPYKTRVQRPGILFLVYGCNLQRFFEGRMVDASHVLAGIVLRSSLMGGQAEGSFQCQKSEVRAGNISGFFSAEPS